MATDVADDAPVDTETQQEPEQQEPASQRRKFNFRGKQFKILALLAVVMAVEAVGIYFVLPQPSRTRGDEDANSTGLRQNE